jgi:RNA polymerase-binding transcription factor DksA
MPRGCPEVQEVKSSEVLRLERYLTFHLAEILEELKSTNERDSDPDSRWRAKWGSSAIVLKECLLRSHDEITLALARMQEGTYGNCVGCGNEIDQRRLEVVPWSKLCIVCHEAGRRQAENRRFNGSRFSAA